MIEIDGAAGEGGGQILRTALALSMIQERPFRIHDIRGRRKRPGLLRQHLTAVRAATLLANAEVEGANLGSRELGFRPRRVRGGSYTFAVGTAGSAMLVLQTVLPALLLAEERSELHLSGGTHNPAAPTATFLQETYLPLLARLGAMVDFQLERHGFAPAGGGRCAVGIEPVAALQPLSLETSKGLRASAATALVAGLPAAIAHRELLVVHEALGLPWHSLETRELSASEGPGNVLSIEVTGPEHTEIFTGFGRRGVRARKVAAMACEEVRDHLDHGAPVGPRLADQLLLPMALAGGGRFLTGPLTGHCRTQIQTLGLFTDLEFTTTEDDAGRVLVVVGAREPRGPMTP